MSNSTIMLTGGGTAGHISPVISVAKKILEKDPKAKLIYIIERNNRSEHLITESGLPIIIKRIFAGKYRRYPTQNFFQKLISVKNNLLNIRDVFYNLLGFMKSLILQIKYHPDVLFSKGGYVSVPVCLSAVVLRRPIVTHDSDSLPGLANRIVGRFAVKNAVGVDGVNYPYNPKKIVFTGVPIRSEFIESMGLTSDEAKKQIDLPEDCQMLFVGGSTQGAKKVDDIFEDIAPKLLEEFPKLYIVQLFGRLNEKSISTRYKTLDQKVGHRLILKTFVSDMYRYVAAADLVISRAGATALAEFGVLAKACIVIPAEHLAEGHQVHNALALQEKGAIVVVREDRAGEELKKSIEYLLQHSKERINLGQILKQKTPIDAAEKIADLVLSSRR